ncbi:hypothetical protein ACIFOC_01821 [Leucobacter aridicollis]
MAGMEPSTTRPNLGHLPRRQSRAAAALLTATAIVLGSVAVGAPAQAVEVVTVETAAELQTVFSDATTDTTIELGSSFPEELPDTVSLSNSAGVALTVDGGGRTLQAPAAGRHVALLMAGTGSASLSNLSLAPAPGGTNGGLQVNLDGTASAEISAITISGLGTSAVGIGGSGSGHLLIEDVTLAGNSASYAAALGYGRGNADATTLMNRISVTDNTGTSGNGYSGGAMLIGNGSRGAVTIQHSLFRGNSFADGRAQPRGGAIAMHNSYVQLTLNNDLFEGNSTYSSTAPGSADGGAVSVMNPNQQATGSLLVTNSSFIGNTAQDDGAAIFVEGQNPNTSRPFTTNLTVTNSTFANNVSGGETTDTGGAIQASLRVDVNIANSTFFGNTKASGRGGVDFGIHTTFNTGGFHRPIGTLTDNVFTRANSVAGMSGTTFTCTGGVDCKVPAGEEDTYAEGIFGSANPAVGVNGTSTIAGDGRPGAESKPVPTLAIVPPLTETTPTASRIVTTETGLTADERGVAYRTTGPQDAGAYTMDYVRYDAATNGGAWSGLTPHLPGAQGSFVSDATATHGWFEVAAPGASAPYPETTPTPPTGMAFAGWFDSETGGTEVTAPVAVAGQTVYAQFTAVEYTVTFDPANGDASFTETVPHGGTVAQPADPVRDGFTFEGWTLEGVEYDFDAEVLGDLTLVATWAETPVVNHTVTFDPDNGDATFTETVIDGDAVAEPADPARDGFTFTGWMLDGAAYDFATPVTGDVTLVAGWEEVAVVTHTVTFDPANGSNTTEILVADGDPVAEPADPARDGFTFTGWALDGTPYEFTTPVSTDITLVAQWEELPVSEFTVTFDPDNGEAQFSETVTEGDAVAEPTDPVRDGFTFAGWTLAGAAYDFATPVTGDITLVAAWQELPAVVHTVTFDPDNGEAQFSQTVPDGAAVTKPADPVRDGFDFTGWALNGAIYDFASPVTADLTLVAGWKAEVAPPVVDPTKPAPPAIENTGGAPIAPMALAAALLLGLGLVAVARARRARASTRE